MKRSIALTLIILIVGGIFARRARQQLEATREQNRLLVAKVTDSGIALDPTVWRDKSRTHRPERLPREVSGMKLATALLTSAKETAALKKTTGAPSNDSQQKRIDLLKTIASLDPPEVKVLITELLFRSRAANDGTGEELRAILTVIVNEKSQIALVLFAESTERLKQCIFGKDLIFSAVTKRMMEDPTAASDWILKNGKEFPEWLDTETSELMIEKVIRMDPIKALKFDFRLGTDYEKRMSNPISQAPTNLEELKQTRDAVIEHFASLPTSPGNDKLKFELMTGLILNAKRQGFDTGTKWLDDSGFNPGQLKALTTSNFADNIERDESGKWIEWFDKTLPAGKADQTISNTIRKWAEIDHRAAGIWLASSSLGAARNITIKTFAETVAHHDPETATKWAMTLPPGQERDQTLKKISQK